MLSNDHIISEALLSSTALPDYEIDLKGNVIGMTLFENVLNPYVHGTIIVVDDFNLRDTMILQGTETIKISIKDQETDEVVSEKRFIVSNIESQVALTDNSDALLLHIVEDFFFASTLNRISKSYSGSLDSIISQILDSELSAKLKSFAYFPNSQGVRKVVIPYMTPLESCIWLIKRISTREGLPFYLYGSIFDKNAVRISSVNALLRLPPVNEKFPANYTGSYSGVINSQKRKLTEIYDVKQVNNENTIGMIERAGYGSSYNTIDLNKGTNEDTHFSIRNIIDQLVIDGIVRSDFVSNAFDPRLNVLGKFADEYNARHIHQINIGKTYKQFYNYHENIENNKMTSEIIKTMLNRNIINFSMNSYLFLNSNTKISVGNKLRLNFLNNDLSAENSEATFDKRKSGDFMLLALRHDFGKTENTTSATAAKVDNTL